MSSARRVVAREDVEGPVSAVVAAAVAEAEGVPPHELGATLYDAVDPDALDALYRREGTAVSVSFTHLGYRVSVDRDGTVTVAPE
ncbi:HalOD1 output domain-containing protein [Halobaculum litoreum]|uniref:HalOD1 output domain-containing protein n=1 Tax=Halobaculum litoreum TaxID=3031998 RepID=UPI0024C2268D|nr:HalOD1 output domain-containing protein [Halobaculum sp. DT92]